jgi:hypothetical protein
VAVLVREVVLEKLVNVIAFIATDDEPVKEKSFFKLNFCRKYLTNVGEALCRHFEKSILVLIIELYYSF